MFNRIQNKVLRETLSWLSVIVFAVVLNLFLRENVFAVTKIDGTSMMPTLHDHQRVYLNRLAYELGDPQHGDITVFPAPYSDQNLIKRIIGLPGDTVEIKKGTVYVNDKPLHESYIDIPPQDYPKTKVEAGHVFLMGDNRHLGGSMDSRDPRVGMIPIDELEGRVDFVIYPHPHVLD
ncbi:MAG TPA: signal peptidase I [Bacilli bacterium]|nr:signal peptidase I [Bacilli bacterium]